MGLIMPSRPYAQYTTGRLFDAVLRHHAPGVCGRKETGIGWALLRHLIA